MSEVASLLMNVATPLFFCAEAKQLHRTYRNRMFLKDLSIVNCSLHMVANFLVGVVSIILCAWISVVVEFSLACFYAYTLYWLLWNVRNRGLSIRDLWYTYRFPCAIWKCKKCGHVNAAIRLPLKCEKCGVET